MPIPWPLIDRGLSRSHARILDATSHADTGPRAAQYLQTLTSFDLKGLTFGKSAYVPIEGFNLHVARGGYTGEDGFEVGTNAVPQNQK